MAELQPNTFKFTLQTQGETVELLNAPDHWDETTVTYGRSQTYQGVIRTLTVPYSFVTKGAGYIRKAFYTDGLMANCKLLVNKQDTLKWDFTQIFKGKIDFTTFEDTVAGVTANVIEDSFTERLSAFDDTKYQIPLDVPEALDIELTPIPLKEQADMICTVITEQHSNYYVPVTIVNNEQHSTIASVQDVGYLYDPNQMAFDPGNGKWFYRATRQNTVTVKGHVEGYATTRVNARYQINFYKDINVLVKTIFDVTNPFGGVNFNFDFDFTVDMLAGDVLFWYVADITGDNHDDGIAITAGTLSLYYSTETPASFCKGLRASYVFDKLVQLMNGQGNGGAYIPQPTQSFLLSGILNQLVFTCSNSIRTLVNGTNYQPGDTLTSGAVYLVVNGAITYNSNIYAPGVEFTAVDDVDTFTSSADGSVILIRFAAYMIWTFKDFFQTIKSVMGGNAGFGLDNGYATLETVSNYLRNIKMLDLGNQSLAPKITPATDYVYNAIKVGYDDQQYDSLNGTQEYNSTQYYTGDLTALKKELDLVSPTRMDALGIESVRNTPQDTSASRSDNDNFGIWLKAEAEGGGFWRPLTGADAISITGVDFPLSVYNWMLSPKRNLLRGGGYLAAVFSNQTTIRFTSALKNVNLVTVSQGGRLVDEHIDVQVANLGEPFFQPVQFAITVTLPQGAINNLNMKYGFIPFMYRGFKFKGYVIETSVDAAQNSQRDFKLLCTSDVNLINFVH